MTKKKQDNEKSSKKRNMISVVAGPLLLGLVFLPTTLLMFTMLLPTAIAGIVDKDRPRALTITIGSANVAGAISVWFELIRRGHTLDAAQKLATDIDALATAYGAAVIGLIIFAVVVPMVAKITSHAADYEKSKIQKHQDKMLKTWGKDVLPSKNTKPEQSAEK